MTLVSIIVFFAFFIMLTALIYSRFNKNMTDKQLLIAIIIGVILLIIGSTYGLVNSLALFK